MIPKIQSCHTDKPAYVYIRQSTMGQVRFHQESTERQYALKDKALELGWSPSSVRILDRDLGQSGTQIIRREDFQSLVADVSMRKVGAVFALEASRLARSCTDWHRLLELCALTGTLIIDEDGCYDPADFNDQLVLGLKGTMSQAELHFLRSRLLGGKLNKAKKGELRFPLPVGLSYDDEKRIVLDPDQEVRGAVQLLFSTFRDTGSAYQVVQHFVSRGIKFPRRSYGGVWNGKLIWGRLGHGRVLSVLKNPSYAGSYVFGRYRYCKEISSEGNIRGKMTAVPMPDWRVMIQDHHEGYITWEEFLENRATLEKNQTNKEAMLLSSPAREGLAMLQGLLLCGICGRRLSVRYQGNGGIYPTYECNWVRREGLSTTSCMALRCDLPDDVVCKRILEVLQPAQIEVALKAVAQLEQRTEAVTRQWKMRLERAEYETELARRRYEEVDPSNRLVAQTLERRWNELLVALDELRQEFTHFQQADSLTATPEQRARIMALAENLPRLWSTPSTPPRERKRILRLLIKDITVESSHGSKTSTLHVRWQGGACEDIAIERPPSVADQVRYPVEVVERVRELALNHQDADIAAELTRAGQRSAKGMLLTTSRIKWIRHAYGIPAATLRDPSELTVGDVARKFGVSPHVVYYWIERDIIPARRVNQGSPYWMTISRDKATELEEWVRNSTKIQSLRTRNPDSKL